MSTTLPRTSAFLVAPASSWFTLWEEYTQGIHPSDLWMPEDWSKPLAVKDIRTVRSFAAQQAVGQGRAIVLPMADQLSREVGNALLKLLEEPPAGLRVLLFGETDRMLATIRSRVPVVHLGGDAELRLVQFYRDLNPLREPEKVKRMLYYAPLFHATLQTDVVLDSFQS